MVRKERLELSILSAVASKTTVYTIPPLAQNCQLKFLMNITNCLVCNYYIVIACLCQHLFKNNLVRLERLEPSIPKAADFKSAVYTIPPQSHFGTKSWTRTSHTLCFKQVLYQMSYLGINPLQ